VISGGGMMNYESTQSFEKLVIDNDICGMSYRLIQGISQRDESLALDLLTEMVDESDFLTHPHTLQWHQVEQTYPHVIHRDSYEQWSESGKRSLSARASLQVQKILNDRDKTGLSTLISVEVKKIMESHAKRFGLMSLPASETTGW